MDKIKSFIKEHLTMSFITIALLAGFVIHRFWFFLILLAYIYLIRLLLSKLVKDNVRKVLKFIIWPAVIILAILIFYVSHYMPQGPMVGTGDYGCAYGDRGPCGEIHEEDMSKLNIPYWAKVLKSNMGMGLIFALVFLGMANKYGGHEKGDENE